MGKMLLVNRAPVMTLWAAVVAQQLGYDPDAALTLGRAVSGMNAQSKGQRLGMFDPAGGEPTERAEKRERQPDEQYNVALLGRSVAVVDTRDGVRAVQNGRPQNPRAVQAYLKQKFGENLPDVRAAMEELAASLDEVELQRRAYALYEAFRPEIPAGKRGWGAAGELDLEKIRELGKKQT